MGDFLNELFRRLLFLPRQGSTIARDIDTLHYTVISATMLGALIVGIVAAVFAIRYRAGTKPFTTTQDIRIPLRIEGMFIVGTLVLFLVWWGVGFRQFERMSTPPPGSMVVYVSAKQWMWHFSYPQGATSIAILYVPTGRPVKLLMSSRDVIHSFFVPDFRVKQDVVPGHTTTTWFEVIHPGTYEILCAEFCGTGHSTMRGEVVALAPEDYAAWIAGAAPPGLGVPPMPGSDPFVVTGEAESRQQTSMVVQGQRAGARYGCFRCHTLDGSAHIGPTFVGVYGATRRFEDGTTRVADEAYLTESMMDPKRHIVAGYLPVMPTYQGILEPGEAAALVELIKSLVQAPGGVSVPPAQPIPGVPRGDNP